tara:strand:- start:1863 stop:2438 length:576 start_codon:yes stop_codon:yes gene_type:complete
MHNEYFREVGIKSNVRGYFLDHLIKGEEGGTLVYHDFIVKVIPDAIISMDPFLSSLMGLFPFRSCLLIMEPLSCYNWHTDPTRGAGVNMLVSAEGDPCLFKGEALSGNADKITVLDYKPDTYYVLNTQNDHMVVNARSIPRLTFSLEFFKDRNNKILSYSEINQGIYEIESSLMVSSRTPEKLTSVRNQIC